MPQRIPSRCTCNSASESPCSYCEMEPDEHAAALEAQGEADIDRFEDERDSGPTDREITQAENDYERRLFGDER